MVHPQQPPGWQPPPGWPPPPPGWQPPPPGQARWPGFTEHAFQPAPAPGVPRFRWGVALGWAFGLGTALALSYVVLAFFFYVTIPVLLVGVTVTALRSFEKGAVDRRSDAVGFGIVAAPLVALALAYAVFALLTGSGR